VSTRHNFTNPRWSFIFI